MLNYTMLSIALIMCMYAPINAMDKQNHEIVEDFSDKQRDVKLDEEASNNKSSEIVEEAGLQEIATLALSQINRVLKMAQDIENFMSCVINTRQSAQEAMLICPEKALLIDALFSMTGSPVAITPNSEEAFSSVAKCNETYKIFSALEHSLINTKHCYSLILEIVNFKQSTTNISYQDSLFNDLIRHYQAKITQFLDTIKRLKAGVKSLFEQYLAIHPHVSIPMDHKIKTIITLTREKIKLFAATQFATQLESEDPSQALILLLKIELNFLNTIYHLTTLKNLLNNKISLLQSDDEAHPETALKQPATPCFDNSLSLIS